MAFCEKCGAYLPMGETACPACGFDPAAEEKRRAVEKAAREAAEKAAKEAAEKAKKEAEKKAAEEKAKQSSGGYHYSSSGASTAQGEYHSHQTGSTQQGTWHAPWESGTQQVYEEYRQKAAASVGRQKLSILSYIGFLFFIPYLTLKGDDFARYHANQGMVLFLTTGVTQIIGRGIGAIGIAGAVFSAYCMVDGIMNVLRGKKKPLPLIGHIELLK